MDGIDDEIWTDEEPEFTPEDEEQPPKRIGAGKTAHDLLPQALVESAIGMDGIARIIRTKAFCLVVQAPSAGWVAPLYRYLRIAGKHWDFHHSKSVAPRSRSQQDDISMEQSMRALTSGGRCLGVSQQLTLLPSAMVASADMTMLLPQPDARVVGAVIRAVTGRLPRKLEDQTIAALDFDEIASAIRSGSTAKACVDRLRAAAAKKVHHDKSIMDAPLLEDLHGYGKAKHWCLELVADLEAWRRGEIPFTAISANVVLAGAPGVGKTTLMKSLARSAGVPLISTSVSAWFANSPGYLDSIIKQIDAIFAQARDAAPAILFLDELDAVPNRATISPRGADWWLPVVTHLLTTLDGAISGATENVMVIAATNHPERLDSALTRSGRLSRIINIPRPDADALAGIFRQHLGADLPSEDLSQAAAMAMGATGADVVELVKNARRRARAAQRPMVLADLMAAVAPDETRSTDLLRRIAVHEAGHAVIAHANGMGRILGISIVQNGDTGGFAHIDNDGRLPTKQDVEKLVMQRLGGRAAEEVLLGLVGTGSGGSKDSDLAVATRQVALMHLGLGMGDSLVYRADEAGVDNILSFDARMTALVEEDLQRLYADAIALARRHVDLIEAVADDLQVRRHIGPGRFLELVDRVHAARQMKEIGNR
ncbi:MAG: AAA family ATPase [Alphaproteobacteria bacterium]|nr:AAA family ATPase [Alphaproteobacteria bacterium]MBU1563090.1 AAA family ATPase [Alphaproteobacteria bacterium]MBU2304285.1 AAA family ATPase [Alphaproteobacteria bacterium]MBU2368286.1 AAA family ATPase [Alphaproteobacteria bacterium]